MIQLYLKTGCPYCAKVLAVTEKYNIPFEERNIAEPGVIEELKEKGGKQQVPFIDDDNMTPYMVDDDVEMYESDAIVAYLEEKFGKNKSSEEEGEIKVHTSNTNSVCQSEPEEKTE